MPIDYSSARGQVRLLIADIDEANEVLGDLEIDGFLGLEADDVRLAAAAALETIATSEVLLLKKLRTVDVDTDGPAVAAQLRALAASLREQVAAAYELDLEEEGGEFGIAELVVDQFTERQRLANELARESG